MTPRSWQARYQPHAIPLLLAHTHTLTFPSPPGCRHLCDARARSCRASPHSARARRHLGGGKGGRQCEDACQQGRGTRLLLPATPQLHARHGSLADAATPQPQLHANHHRGSPPKASPMHWWPMHTPKRGNSGPSSRTTCREMPESMGLPACVPRQRGMSWVGLARGYTWCQRGIAAHHRVSRAVHVRGRCVGVIVCQRCTRTHLARVTRGCRLD